MVPVRLVYISKLIYRRYSLRLKICTSHVVFVFDRIVIRRASSPSPEREYRQDAVFRSLYSRATPCHCCLIIPYSVLLDIFTAKLTSPSNLSSPPMFCPVISPRPALIPVAYLLAPRPAVTARDLNTARLLWILPSHNKK